MKYWCAHFMQEWITVLIFVVFFFTGCKRLIFLSRLPIKRHDIARLFPVVRFRSIWCIVKVSGIIKLNVCLSINKSINDEYRSYVYIIINFRGVYYLLTMIFCYTKNTFVSFDLELNQLVHLVNDLCISFYTNSFELH